MKWLVAALLSGVVGVAGSAASTCLESGLPPENRSYLQDSNGQELALGLLEYDWPSARLVTQIAAILLEEQLGYHVSFEYRTSSFIESLRQLAGCAEGQGTGILGPGPDGVPRTVQGDVVRPCSAEVRCHVALDSPVGRNEFTQLAFRAATPFTSPEDVGSMGYFSEQNLAVSSTIHAAAYEDSGLALDYYLTYNQSLMNKYKPLFKPTAYFDELSGVDRAEIFECTDAGLEFTDPIKMAAYVNWTGDEDGVVRQADGSYAARCPDGHFWLAPSCRHNASECIPTFTSGNGWLADAFMQWATHHGIPLAIGISRSSELYVRHVSQFRSLFIWWLPDTTLREVSPLAVRLPVHDVREWAVGNKRTAAAGSAVRKLVSADLRVRAPRAQRFFARMSFRFQELQVLLDEVGSAEESEEEAMREIACKWVKENGLTWEGWVPRRTDCDAGFGLVNYQGDFVSSLESAVSCKPCPSGHFSDWTNTSGGISGGSYVCVACPAGSFQALPGKSLCDDCALGHAADEAGATECGLCDVGTFADQEGSTACKSCGDDTWTTKELAAVDVDQGHGSNGGGARRWIEVRGAVSKDVCSCVEGRHFWQGQCELCLEGATCLGPTNLTLDPGFFAFAEDPNTVFRCFGSSRRCPGGLPGSCSPGRDNQSLACAQCLPGLHDNYDGSCVMCDDVDWLILAVLASLLFLVPSAVHAFTLAMQLTPVGHSLMEVTFGVGQMVTSAQVLVIMQQGIQWGEPFIRLLESLEFVSLDFLWRIVNSVNCVVSFTPELRFFSQSLLFPSIFLLVPMATHVVYVRCWRQGQTQQFHLLRKTLGSLSVLFFIPALSSLLAPFRCDVHPSDTRTMQVYESVECDFSGSHLRMCLMGGVVSLCLLSFLVFVFWLVYVELPKRLEAFDVEFLRSFSFLWARFRPGSEAFALFFLVRNAVIVVSPLLPSSFSSLFFIKFVLYISFCAIAFFKPLRTTATLYLELVIHVGFMVILDMGMLFMPQEDTSFVMVACMLVSLLVLLVILLMVAQAVFQKCRSTYRKQFHFFISHQKSAAGSLARLFKIELSKCGFRCFIDCDDLTDLTRLFSYVSQDVETLAVLASGDFLTRKWCVGELVTARLHGVKTMLVALPDFTMPDERFVASYTSLAPKIKELAVYGIGMAEIHETLLWLGTLEKFDLQWLSNDPIPEVVSWLTGMRGHSPNRLPLTKNSSASTDLSVTRVVSNMSECLILCDTTNMEAMAAAHVLYALLGVKMMELSMKTTLRILLGEDEVFGSGESQVLFLCTAGCLEVKQVASCLVQLNLESSWILPVLAEDSFQIPTFHEAKLSYDIEGVDMERYSYMLEAAFHEISVPFTPRSSNARQLDLQAKIIAERLTHSHHALRTKHITSSQELAGLVSPMTSSGEGLQGLCEDVLSPMSPVPTSPAEESEAATPAEEVYLEL